MGGSRLKFSIYGLRIGGRKLVAGRFYEFYECKYIFNMSYNLRRSIASTVCPWISRNKYNFYIVQYTFISPGSR